VAKFTQAELEHKSEVFMTNGQLPQAQAVISKVGYILDFRAQNQPSLICADRTLTISSSFLMPQRSSPA